MQDRLKTVKARVILMMVLFAVLVSTLVAIFSFYLMATFQRKTTVQSTEFNLQLVANVVEQDFRELAALGKWCGANTQITDYFTSDANPKRNSLTAYNRLNEEYINNRASLYVRRLIVVDNSKQKILQVGNFYNTSEPVTIYTVDRLEGIGSNITSQWERIVPDLFYFIKTPAVIPLLCPVYSPRSLNVIGSVYLTVSTAVITDKFKGYHLTPGAALYLTLGENHYLMDGNAFVPVKNPFTILSYNDSDPVSGNTTAAVVRTAEGERRTVVSYPVRSGISLTQVLAAEELLPQKGTWILLLGVLCLLIGLLAVLITMSLDRAISRPVARLRMKIDAIALGDFSPDPELEWHNELGQVGRGINRLSRDVVALMERRIADEKNKRDLEYRMLQSQINPHFLYNTLNSIKWMATLQGADGIAEMTTSLSRLMKTAAKDLRKVVPLRDELALVDEYITIQKYRYGGSIALTKEIEDDMLLEAPIPRFSLQPIVENAIFHGIEPKGAGHILVKVTENGSDVLCSITDDGVGMSEEKIRELFSDDPDQPEILRRLGVHNVDDRLRYAFGEGYGLTIDSKEGVYTAMTIKLPLY